MKPDTGDEAMGASSRRAFRGDWGRRVWMDQSGTWETRSRRRQQRAEPVRERITGTARKRESERPIVARKPGNAGGAKGPYGSNAESEARRTAWRKSPLRKPVSILERQRKLRRR